MTQQHCSELLVGGFAGQNDRKKVVVSMTELADCDIEHNTVIPVAITYALPWLLPAGNSTASELLLSFGYFDRLTVARS